MQSNLVTHKLLNSFSRVPKRTLLSSFDSLAGKLKETVRDATELKLALFMDSVPRRKLRLALDRIVRRQEKANRMISRVFHIITKIPKLAFDRWALFLHSCKKNEILDNLKSEKLLNCLQKPTKKPLRSGFNSIVGNGNHAKGVITRALKKVLKKPKSAFSQWAEYSKSIENSRLLNLYKSQKLKNAMENIVQRTTRNTTQRIIGDGNRLKGFLNNLGRTFKNKPRLAFNKWKEYVNDCNTKKILNNLKSQKLQVALNRLPKRTLKSSLQRVVGDGNRVKGVFYRIFDKIKKKPLEALRKWVNYADNINKKKLLDSFRSEKLKSTTKEILRRSLRNAFQRVLGDGDKVKAVIKNLEAKTRNIPRQALNAWKKYVDNVSNKQLFDNLRSQKLKTRLGNLHKRTIKDVIERISGDGNKVKGALKSIANSIKKKQRQALTQ